MQPGQFDVIAHHRRMAEGTEQASPTKGQPQAQQQKHKPLQMRALFSLSSARKAVNGFNFTAVPPAATRLIC